MLTQVKVNQFNQFKSIQNFRVLHDCSLAFEFRHLRKFFTQRIMLSVVFFLQMFSVVLDAQNDDY